MVANPAGFTPAEYLALERQATIRHEFRCGFVYAMAGGSGNHSRIAINLLTAFNLHFADDTCQFFSGDVKLNYADDFYYYPDAFVTCDPRDRDDSYVKRYPKLIAEVLSPSTAELDRQDKFADYQKLATLEEYALISQDDRRVEVFRKSGETWQITVFDRGDRVVFASIGLEVPIADLYRGTDV
ncbi:MAG: Uma2 family endonuclease [Geitlerinemataceae cyanobacterium]